MIQSGKVFSGLIMFLSILQRHKLGLEIAFVISMAILLVPPLPCPPPITYYIPVLLLSPPLSFSFSLSFFFSLSFCLLTYFDPLSPSVLLRFLSQPVTLSFLPWRQCYQSSASGKLRPESFLELEIGGVQGWRFSRRMGRACFTRHLANVSRDSSPRSLLPPC